MAKKPHSMLKVVQNLGWPVFWGLVAFIGLLFCFENGVITNEIVIRYATAHPVSYVVTLMFCIGTASLLLKSSDIFQQFTSLDRVSLEEHESHNPINGSQADGDKSLSIIERANGFLNGLELMSGSDQRTYLWRRLHDALDSIRRGGAKADPDEELKYLSDMDAARQQDGFALVRILIWATPMLGFLGTVIGISEALGSLNVGAEQNFEQMMSGLRESLYVAFDTTALALTLSIVLMFGQFLVDRFETQLLSAVDDSASDQINSRFRFSEEEVASRDPYLESVKRMSLMVLQSIEQISEKQSEVWKDSIGNALQEWQTGLIENSNATGHQFAAVMRESMHDFTTRLQATLEESDTRVTRRWDQWQTSLSENSRMMHQQQQEMVRQAEMLDVAVKSCGDVVQMQDALNENLNALSRADSFEQMIVTLSAAISLLSTKLDASPRVSQSTRNTSGRAA